MSWDISLCQLTLHFNIKLKNCFSGCGCNTNLPWERARGTQGRRAGFGVWKSTQRVTKGVVGYPSPEISPQFLQSLFRCSNRLKPVSCSLPDIVQGKLQSHPRKFFVPSSCAPSSLLHAGLFILDHIPSSHISSPPSRFCSPHSPSFLVSALMTDDFISINHR